MNPARLTSVLVLAAAACGVGPQPQPVPGRLVELRVEHITIEADADQAVIAGEPGAVTAGSGRLFVLGLEGTAEEAEVAVAADGSFEARVAGTPSDLYRLEAWVETYRSPPVDLTAGTDAGGAAIDAADLGCASWLVQRRLHFGSVPAGALATVQVELENVCGGVPIRVLGARARLGAAAVALDASLPMEIAPAGPRLVGIEVRPAAEGAVREVLVLDVDQPAGRAAITLEGTACPTSGCVMADGGGGVSGGSGSPR